MRTSTFLSYASYVVGAFSSPRTETRVIAYLPCDLRQTVVFSRVMNRLLFLLLVFLALFISASAQPCMKATTDCTEWVSLGDHARSLVYRTYSLETKNEKI